ncbi:hypothetical protein PybrP1_009527 [[Pythium] brassicae (nom. inval.)]|nr:hypothetical protein PybrP1_009527 [[Pythium] brassicae (nom. inval.)]
MVLFLHSLTILLLPLLYSAALAFDHPALRDAFGRKLDGITNADGAALPVFFFHGLGSSANSGDNFRANLTADGRVFTALTFCEELCSGKALELQVHDAIEAIKSIVDKDASTYKDGYIFVGLSQGALLARSVVEYWDDHDVKTLISFAGPQNGLFYGPQKPDFLALGVLSVYGPKAVDPRLFDFSKFTPADFSGRIQRAIGEIVLFPYIQNELALVDMLHPPVAQRWVATNPFLGNVNNVNVCGVQNAVCRTEQQRRRANFLKLRTAHFFGSPQDDFISPWQSAILGEYTEVRTPAQLESLFTQLRVLDMDKTVAYRTDSYGLQTLDKRGGLFLHAVPNVGHSCWVRDYITADGGLDCKFQPVYDAHIYPVLRDPLRCKN